MSSIKRTAADKLRALRNAVSDEILSMTDEDILVDARNNGLDPDDIALTMKSKAMDMIANIRKQKLKNIRENLNAAQPKLIKPIITLSLEEKKKKILEFFAKPNTNYSLAFRNGDRQSESDWESLWDDIVEQGLLDDESSEN
ncbi:MAG: hypothetical protein K9L79_07305 [Methylobacter tundripaludum]|nr:hypothetical protein [Methylobacter tundripaludum]